MTMTFHSDPIEIKGPEQRPSLAALFMDLLDDAKCLINQEVRLARHEFQESLGNAKSAAVGMSVGIGLLAVSGLLLIVMLVHMLQAFTDLPLWVCYGIVGVMIGVTGAFFLVKGQKNAASIQMVPRRTMETMKENATWIRAQSQKI
jgi:hypothetical protein